MLIVHDTPDSPKQFVPVEWARGMDQEGLLSLLYMPHFSRSLEINACVKHLLVPFHGGYLCHNQQIFVDVKLIAIIASLQLASIDPTSYLRKDQETALENKMKDKYDLCRDSRGSLIPLINDHTVQFIAKVLARKLFHKMRSSQYTVGVVALVELYVKGVQIN